MKIPPESSGMYTVPGFDTTPKRLTQTMAGRGQKTYYRRDNDKPISADDMYHMLMLYQYQRFSIARIARKFSLDPIEVRIIIGKRTGGSCCG